MIQQKQQPSEGWFWAWPNTKRHYFRNGKSLCCKVTIPGGFFKEDTGKENCCQECFFIRKEEKT